MSNSHPSNVLEHLLPDASDLPGLGPQRRPGAWPLARVNQRAADCVRGTALLSATKELIRGTLLLWHDHLDAAHAIAQAVEDADGSLLHAIMHRREPDYWNSKYWFRRVGKHPCYPAIAANASALLKPEHPKLASRLISNGVWDPFAFVDACEKAASTGTAGTEVCILQEIQRLEFESFLAHLSSSSKP